jgi:hypothetical protein
MPISRPAAHQLTMANTQGDTTSETVARIQELFRQDRRRTIHGIGEEVDIGYGTCQRVLTKELGMHHVAAKFAPRILTTDQEQPAVSGVTQNGCQLPPAVLT